MWAIREEKVPQLQYLRQRRCASTQCQYTGKSINLSLHALGRKMGREFRVHNAENLIHERETPMHTVHTAAHIARTLIRNVAIKRRKGFGLTPRGVKKRRRHDIHTLHITNVGRNLASSLRVLGPRDRATSTPRTHGAGRGVHTFAAIKTFGYAKRGRRRPTFDAGFVEFVQFPCHGVEDSGETILGHSSPEERIGSERAKGVISNLGICG